MATIKPSLAKGTRDFSPVDMGKRNYIYDTLKSVFKKYGYQEIQTPTFENLSTLTGKYGDEGDKLIFKILNSGDYLSKVPDNIWQEKSSQSLLPKISEKASRYDRTVPFARYVVMHQNDITLPFKRFQIQPVWRADRPQKGRYREFYQCDVDVVGSESLLNEAEFVLIYQEGLSRLGLKDFTIKINNRKILTGIAELLGKPSLIISLTVAIDKLDKIGIEGVQKELLEKGFTEEDLNILEPLFSLESDTQSKLNQIKQIFPEGNTAWKGIEEIEEVLRLVSQISGSEDLINQFVEFDITLARGLNYYTGCIFEVKTNEVQMGSIGGGGRYDDLTGMFGLKNLTGVGISFGADRIFDVMEELSLFPSTTIQTTQVLLTHFDESSKEFALPILHSLRNLGISCELYPESAKLKKQLGYADAKKIPFVALIGETERTNQQVSLKNMETGDQSLIKVDELAEYLKNILV